MLPLAWEWKVLGYCYEQGDENNTEHTHMIIEFKEKEVSKRMLLNWWRDMQGEGELEVKSHTRIETIIGYHIGLGDKPSCGDNLVMITPHDFNPKEYLKKKVMHRATDLKSCRERNKLLLEEDLKTLVDEGAIHLEKLAIIKMNKHVYNNLVTETRGEIPDVIRFDGWSFDFLMRPLTEKLRHYWVWSKESNRGKTTFGLMLMEKYKTAFKGGDWNCWEEIEPSTEIIVLEEFRGELKIQQLNILADGYFTFNKKFEKSFKLKKKPYIFVLSNVSMSECYPTEDKYLRTRFIEVNVD